MNKKQIVKSDWKSPYLYEVKVTSGSKTYALAKGQLVSVNRRPGLIAGKYEFLFAEYFGSELLLHVEGPISRERRRKLIRQTDVKTVHIKTERRA